MSNKTENSKEQEKQKTTMRYECYQRAKKAEKVLQFIDFDEVDVNEKMISSKRWLWLDITGHRRWRTVELGEISQSMKITESFESFAR